MDGFVDRGMKIEESKLTGMQIKKEGDKFIVSRTHADGKTIEKEIYDQVFNCWARVCKTDGLGLDHMPGIEVTKGESQTIFGGSNGVHELTGNSRVFAVGDVLKGTARNNPAAEFGGKRVANMIRDLINLESQKEVSKHNQAVAKSKEEVYKKYQNFSYFPMPMTVFSTPSASSIGMMEEEAVAAYGKDNVKSVMLSRKPLMDDFANNRQGMHYYKVVSLRDSGKVMGLHYVGEEGEELMYGLSIAMKQGLTVQTMQDSFFIHPSRSEVFWKAAEAETSYTIDSC